MKNDITNKLRIVLTKYILNNLKQRKIRIDLIE
jgi:hypothetical protein